MIDQQTYTRQELAQFFLRMVVISFLLHSIWEMLQMPAYQEMAGRPLLDAAMGCARAALGDVVITLWIYILGALAAQRISWGLQPHGNVYLAAALLGAIHALCLEQTALASGRWSYTGAMPVIPRLKVGLWPLLQLLLLPPLTIALSSCYALRKPRCASRSHANSPTP